MSEPEGSPAQRGRPSVPLNNLPVSVSEPRAARDRGGPRSDPPDQPDRSARSCGACRACCVVFDVPEVGKSRNEPCPHADTTGLGPGCRVYSDRPGTCRAFECAWKQGLAGEGDRPDLIGVLFYLIPLTDGAPGLGAIELDPGSFETGRGRALLAGFESRKPGRILVRRAAEGAFRPASVLIEGKPLRAGAGGSAGVIAGTA